MRKYEESSSKERKGKRWERRTTLSLLQPLSRLRDFNVDSLFSEVCRFWCVHLIGRRTRGSPLRILVDPRSSLATTMPLTKNVPRISSNRDLTNCLENDSAVSNVARYLFDDTAANEMEISFSVIVFKVLILICYFEEWKKTSVNFIKRSIIKVTF